MKSGYLLKRKSSGNLLTCVHDILLNCLCDTKYHLIQKFDKDLCNLKADTILLSLGIIIFYVFNTKSKFTIDIESFFALMENLDFKSKRRENKFIYNENSILFGTSILIIETC